MALISSLLAFTCKTCIIQFLFYFLFSDFLRCRQSILSFITSCACTVHFVLYISLQCNSKALPRLFKTTALLSHLFPCFALLFSTLIISSPFLNYLFFLKCGFAGEGQVRLQDPPARDGGAAEEVQCQEEA